MVSKLLIVCALACAIQGLNARPEGRPRPPVETALFRESMDYFQTLEKEYGSIIDRFENVVMNAEAEGPDAEFGSENFEDVMASLEEFYATEMNEEAAGNNIIVECIRAERENFQKLVQQMRQRAIDAAVQLRQFTSETLGPYIQKAREAFRTMGDAIALFPAKMWECIQEGNIMKAIQVVKETRMVVTTNARIMGDNIKEARAKFPLIRKMAQQMRQQIRNEAAAGMKAIRMNIRKCIVNGGPKPMIEQVPITDDISVLAPAENVMTVVAPEEQVSTLIAPADAVVDVSE